MTPNEEDIIRLKNFYAAETDMDLIIAQNKHIERLQEKLRQFEPSNHLLTRKARLA
jgi:hypothetical protein